MAQRPAGISILGASENNLRDVDVALSPGITAVVGVSGSGKSSLVFDTLYREARRRFLDMLASGSRPQESRPRVRAIAGLRPVVAVGQNLLNRDPNSTVATAVGIHPSLRVLYARFAERHCLDCGADVAAMPLELQLAMIRQMVASGKGHADLLVPLVQRAEGSHARLLVSIAERFPREDIEVDGVRWGGQHLNPDEEHRIAVRLATLTPGLEVRELRLLLEAAASPGGAQVSVRSDGTQRTLSRAPLCPECGRRLPILAPGDFRRDHPAMAGYRLSGATLPELLALDVRSALEAIRRLQLPSSARSAIRQVDRRLAALSEIGLDYITLDRSSPTLSRGEGQRIRLAVILANRVDGLLHIVDEPAPVRGRSRG